MNELYEGNLVIANRDPTIKDQYYKTYVIWWHFKLNRFFKPIVIGGKTLDWEHLKEKNE